MTFPTTVGADPDPTTQIPWPQRRIYHGIHAESTPRSSADDLRLRRQDNKKSGEPENEEIGKRRLTTWNLVYLSISMAGAQVAWTVELGYGTPFLLSLGLSEQLTSLVWLAGPISGLIAQPLIGAISDSSKSRYRRRYWVITSTLVLVASTLALAYCKEVAVFLVDIFGGGVGDWDPEREKQESSTAIGLAVASFYLLDFSLNAVQASLRNLLLDVTPSTQLNAGNAWHGRMTHAGNIVGYGLGFFPLDQLPVLRLLGGNQFRKFCVVAMAILIATVSITCFTQDERAGVQDFRDKRSKLRDVMQNIWNAIVNLPKPIRRVCFVQIFAYMGWFPFLFYATTYVGQVMARENKAEPDPELATRTGELALLLYSIVAVAAGTLIPHLARRDHRLLFQSPQSGDESENEEIVCLRNTVREWRAEAAAQGRPLILPKMPFMLRNIWSAAMVLFSILTFSTFLVNTVVQATIVISLIGVCWAVACWVPFAIIMEFLKEIDENAPSSASNNSLNHPTTVAPSGRVHTRAVSSPSVYQSRRDERSNESQPLLRRRYSFSQRDEAGLLPGAVPVAGGTILGIHNLAIVLPQFLSALVASAIFRFVDSTEGSDPNTTYLGKNGVAWLFRFGGVCTLIGAAVARMVPPTKTEREMRRRLGEMELLKEQGTP